MVLLDGRTARVLCRCVRQYTATVVEPSTTTDKPAKRSWDIPAEVTIDRKTYTTDTKTNVTPGIIQLSQRRLMNEKGNALRLFRQRIEAYFADNYKAKGGRSPMFSSIDSLHPVVSTWQNFDSLLVPADHVSRSSSDTFYVNEQLCLRAHTSAHEHELIKSGLDSFIVFGDVYRRDEVDRTHFPVFHQMEGVRLMTPSELFLLDERQPINMSGEILCKFMPDFQDEPLQMFETTPDATRQEEKQETHTKDAAQVAELKLKKVLEGLAKELFGKDVEYRWVSAYFPFTHPSWEMEVWHDGKWLETLGCGILEQEILERAGASHKLGWAFGLGLERLAMRLYGIRDIRTFWSTDTGITSQFDTDDFKKKIEFKAISQFPQCTNDISFWLPDTTAPNVPPYSPNDFYDLVRTIGGDLVEQVSIFDEFYHPKLRRHSHAYRVTYRHMSRVLTQAEVNQVHEQIELAVVQRLGGELR